MEMLGIFGLINLFFAIVIGLYFWNLLRQQQTNKSAVDKESKKELEKLQRLKSISLTQPLSERTRPADLKEIIGQADGLKSLRAALCGPNPQHVLVYGPPGVGKTAAARVVLEEAKQNNLSPFRTDSRFVEVDATIARFDERGIADPLLGSVHDPIYQGAGAMGIAGIPQPKPGAVTKAHGGLLFIDEIGELHPIQLNKLLKVLEDRKVFLESAYYSSEDTAIPAHIHDMFQNGLPADFRLVGATTRMPHELPPAIRSRCLEVFFRQLTPPDIGKIASHAVEKIGFSIAPEALAEVERYASNGREAVNMVQIACGIAQTEQQQIVSKEIVEWVVQSSQHNPRPQQSIPESPQVGLVNGLAVYGPNLGMLIEVEAAAVAVENGTGQVRVTGVMEEEEMGGAERVMRRRSMARSSVDNVLTVLLTQLGIQAHNYDLHINFPGSIPLDGPSAGVAMAAAVFSAITGRAVRHDVAMTGEVTIHGLVKGIGGVLAKIEAARLAGVKTVLIPCDNWQEAFACESIEICPIASLREAVDAAVLPADDGKAAAETPEVLSQVGVRPVAQTIQTASRTEQP